VPLAGVERDDLALGEADQCRGGQLVAAYDAVQMLREHTSHPMYQDARSWLWLMSARAARAGVEQAVRRTCGPGTAAGAPHRCPDRAADSDPALTGGTR
jgi:hypothetical protein